MLLGKENTLSEREILFFVYFCNMQIKKGEMISRAKK